MSATLEAGERTTVATQEMGAGGTAAAGLPWGLWRRQALAVMRLELRKNFLSRRSLLLYLIAGTPLVLITLAVLFAPQMGDFADVSVIFAAIFNGLILRTLIFFGCAWVFMNLFRGEVVDRSLHYYFLTPARREVLVVGKYLSGLVTTGVLFSVMTVGSMLLFYFVRYYAESTRYFFDGPGLRQMFVYLGITILACFGYGAVFLIIGLFFRNPVIPALVMYGWEWINFLLPPLLKKVSVIHYLHSLAPVPLSEGPFAVLAEPTPAWISVPSLFVFTLFVLALASLYIRRMEISYAGE
jgi:ABC-type transport system involved in multi-copper enzyme maturation permease subunit